MTKEERLMALFEAYNNRKEEIEKEYDRRFDNVPVNKYGEADADYILKVNEWYDATIKHLDRLFGRKVAKII